MARDDRLLHLLKTRGPQRAADLAGQLGVSASAVRQHLGELADAELVDHRDRRETTGRPKRYWRLTERGESRFPDTHSQLTTELLRSVRVLFGEDGLEKLITERERISEASYRRALGRGGSLGERVTKLAQLRSAEGYMAQCRDAGDGEWLLLENHCPICAAARECEGFCRSELDVFRRLLGRRVTVEREDHILAGARRCAYRIRPRAPARGNPAGARLGSAGHPG